MTEQADSPMSYGFIGTGEITEAIVTGMHGNTADPPAVFLSPRGRRTAGELAANFPNVHVCASNQEVLEHARLIVLAVRPQIADTVLNELRFHPRHVVISAIAGVQLAHLDALTGPAASTVRAIPLPQAADGQSLTAMYPHQASAQEMFSRVGTVLIPESERALKGWQPNTPERGRDRV